MKSTYNADSIADAFNAQAQRNAQSGGPRTEYAKLSAGATILRHLPSDPLFVKVVKRMFKWNGKYTSFMDYGYLLAMPELAEAAIDNNRITAEDLEKAGTFGDPFKAIDQAAETLGVEDNKRSRLWSRTRYFWNVISVSENDNTVRLFDSSKQYFEQLMKLHMGVTDDNGKVVKKGKDVFDPVKGRDVIIVGNGKEGIARRYEAPEAADEATKVEFDPEDLIDLNAKALQLVRPWDECAKCAIDLFGDLAAQCGITADKWGV